MLRQHAKKVSVLFRANASGSESSITRFCGDCTYLIDLTVLSVTKSG
jgi:hypothetical protein